MRCMTREPLFEIFHANTCYTRASFPAQAMRMHRHLRSLQAVQASSRNFKVYRFAERSVLPQPCPSTMSLSQALQQRVSVREFSRTPMSLPDLANVLVPAAACNRVATVAGNPLIELRFRSYPSGGAEYPLELYPILLRIVDVPACITHFDPRARALSLLQVPVDMAALERSLMNPGRVLETAAALLVITAVFERSTAKYGDRGYRLILLEAGHLAQNLCLAATAAGLGSLAWGGFYDGEINRLLDVDGLTEAVLHCVFLGVPGHSAPAAGPGNPHS